MGSTDLELPARHVKTGRGGGGAPVPPPARARTCRRGVLNHTACWVPPMTAEPPDAAHVTCLIRCSQSGRDRLT